MAKPFSIQSPEDIAKEYGGNKQKIGQAMQLGIVDPTAGVLAGMFIDRMRSPQTMEGANPPTVAQQVMGGAPAASPPSPASPGGLEALPQGAPSMAPPPEMGAMPAPEGPPMGMAEGGIVGLDIPDTMFDESSNGGFDEGYAGGGLVAFAGGGMTDKEYLDYIRRKESRGRDYDKNGKPLRSRAGAMYAMQVLPSTARDPGYGVDPVSAETPEEYNRVGSDLALALRKKYGDVGGAMAYNWGPGNYQKWRDAGSPAERIPSETRNYVSELGGLNAAAAIPERNTDSAAGRAGSLQDLMGMMGTINKKSDDEVAATDKYRAMLTERASDEDYEKQRKEDMWATLAEIGFNMASSKSPFVLQAIGEAAAAALPGARASKKERKETKDRAIEGLMELGARDRKEAAENFKAVVPLWQEGIRAEQFAKGYGLDVERLKQQGELTREEIAAQRDIAAMRPESLDFRERFAKDIFADYVRRNAIGNLIVNGKRLPPNSKSNEELRVMAMQEVVNRMPSGQQSGGFDPSTGLPVVTPTGGGKQQVVTTDYGQM